MISYGPRSNDILLAHYGFVQAGNPHDSFAMDGEKLLVALAQVRRNRRVAAAWPPRDRRVAAA